MSLLSLQGIGKIYVSAGNVTVGIRGVDLSFERGEFVAVTGESGSGKSTLLNVISGMDSYEEGELLIEGEPTSHYVEADWEAYRERYISFVFQDYNIIESFTVLQNVELALMHLPSAAERRARATELLARVGLSDHLHHKGSRLSGGQKQRTVIARALAKDSPIILADEPTGNLDSATSREIIALLREVAKDKLLIVVTHDFEEVREVATRHVRIFDGAVEFDRRLRAAEPTVTDVLAPDAPVEAEPIPPNPPAPPASPWRRLRTTLRDGIALGRIRFFAMPKLSAFLCVLMLLAALSATFVTSLVASALPDPDASQRYFTYHRGRVILIRQDGAVIEEEELSALAEQVGAAHIQHYDFLLDQEVVLRAGGRNTYFAFSYGNYDGLDVGRAPAAAGEVMLRVPISLYEEYGGEAFTPTPLPRIYGASGYLITGIDYYYDNTVRPSIVLTEEGYHVASALAFLSARSGSFYAELDLADETGASVKKLRVSRLGVSFDLPAASYGFFGKELQQTLTEYSESYGNRPGAALRLTLFGNYVQSSYRTELAGGADLLPPSYGEVGWLTEDLSGMTRVPLPASLQVELNRAPQDLILSPDLLLSFFLEKYYPSCYTQASLFFESDRAAARAVSALRERGYRAFLSDAQPQEQGAEAFVYGILRLILFAVWLGTVLLVALVLALCAGRAMLSTRGDIAVMRSMGIPTAVIKSGIYTATLISLLPAYLLTALTAILVYTTPATNAIFPFLHGWEYLAIGLAMLLVAIRISQRNVRKMFEKSVKNTLKGEMSL